MDLVQGESYPLFFPQSTNINDETPPSLALPDIMHRFKILPRFKKLIIIVALSLVVMLLYLKLFKPLFNYSNETTVLPKSSPDQESTLQDSMAEIETTPIDSSGTAPDKPSLNEEEQRLLDEAIQFYEKSKENLDRMKIDGHNKIFDPKKIETYKSQLGSSTQTNEVVEALLNLNELNNTYYQNGYRKDEYQLIFHQVEEGKWLHSISQKHKVSIEDIHKYNPKDTDENGNINRNQDGSLPTLVIYKKY